MRIRQVKPDYWRDELLASLPDSVSRFYIGMWQEADDAGWLRWNVSEIALDLYGYHPRARRERWVRERAEALAKVGRLHLYECGHAFLPTLTKHQKFGGRPVFSVRDAHARDCARLRADDRPGKERVEVEVGNGKKRKGSDSSNRETANERSALTVACAVCQVDVGEPCRGVRATRNGEPWQRWAVHRERWHVSRHEPNEEPIDALRVAIDQNRSILDDPTASDAVKRAARKFLMSVGEAA